MTFVAAVVTIAEDDVADKSRCNGVGGLPLSDTSDSDVDDVVTATLLF